MTEFSPMKFSHRADIDSLEKIQRLVNSFYSAVRQDPLLGPIFEEFIRDWDAHPPTMYRFWERLLFGSGTYQNNPFQKHVHLPLKKQHFTAWVSLFIQTVDDQFAGQHAERAKQLARSIAGTFQLRMGIEPENAEHAIPNYSRN